MASVTLLVLNDSVVHALAMSMVIVMLVLIVAVINCRTWNGKERWIALGVSCGDVLPLPARAHRYTASVITDMLQDLWCDTETLPKEKHTLRSKGSDYNVYDCRRDNQFDLLYWSGRQCNRRRHCRSDPLHDVHDVGWGGPCVPVAEGFWEPANLYDPLIKSDDPITSHHSLLWFSMHPC